MIKRLLIILTILAMASIAEAGIRDRSSGIELYGSPEDPGNYIMFPDVIEAPGTPDSGYGYIYFMDGNVHFKNDEGSMVAEYQDTIGLSNSEIKNLRASPKVLVESPGADAFIEVVSVTLILDYGSNALSESDDNLVVEYGTSGNDITAVIEMTGFIDETADSILIAYPSSPLASNAASDMLDNTVELFNEGDGEFGDNAGDDTTMTVVITYRVHTTDL